MAGAVAIPYLLLNVVVLGRGLIEIAGHPEFLSGWKMGLQARGDWTMLLVGSALVFPRLALGMSGFETGVSVMPLVHRAGRIRSTCKLLAAAALIMSVMLITSSFVTTLLKAYQTGGEAAGRAIAYLAHHYLGSAFGTIYDLATILILWFAGASAMAGLLNLVPRYLPRFGMAPRWVAFHRPLVLVLFGISVAVTLVFKANVEAQSGAYATGVLALMLSAAIAVALALRREKSSVLLQGYFWVVAAVFAYTLGDNVIGRPDGVIISGVFILAVVVLSGTSRWRRATELRVAEVRFVDDQSAALWPAMEGKKVNLVPLRTSTLEARQRKAAEIHKYYPITGPIAFTHVNLLDNRSEFLATLEIKVSTEENNYVIEVLGAVAIANTIAYVSELIDPVSIFLGLTRRNPMEQALRFLLWGEGETGLMVYTILLRYWEATPEDDVRPLIFLMSE